MRSNGVGCRPRICCWKRELASQSSFSQIIGQSDAMQKVYEVIRKVADSKSNVLIGGTASELVARANPRAGCSPSIRSAVPETLLESEPSAMKACGRSVE